MNLSKTKIITRQSIHSLQVTQRALARLKEKRTEVTDMGNGKKLDKKCPKQKVVQTFGRGLYPEWTNRG